MLFVTLALGGIVSGQQTMSGQPVTFFTNQVLNTTEVFSDPVDLQSYDSVGIILIPTAALPSIITQVGLVRYQWAGSTNATAVWAYEPVLTAGAATATDQPYTYLSKRVDFTLLSTTIFPDRVRRMNRFFRLSVVSTNAVTTATLKATFVKENNGN